MEIGGRRTSSVTGVDNSVLVLDVFDDTADEALGAVGGRVDGNEFVGAGGRGGHCWWCCLLFFFS